MNVTIKAAAAIVLAIGYLAPPSSAHAAVNELADFNAGPESSEYYDVDGIAQNGFYHVVADKAIGLLKAGSQVGLYITDGKSLTKIMDAAEYAKIDVIGTSLHGYNYFWLTTGPADNPYATMWRTNGVAVEQVLTGKHEPLYGQANVINYFGAKIDSNLLLIPASVSIEDVTNYNAKVFVINANTSTAYQLKNCGTTSSSGANMFSADSASFNGYRFFGAESCDGTSGELWMTNGTLKGTVRLATAFDSIPYYFKQAGEKVYFRAAANAHGSELWVTDGTASGTHMVKDILFGGSSSRPSPLQAIGNKVLFSATSADFYREYWVSDGTDAGTHRLTSLGNATTTGYLGWATSAGSYVYFTGTSDNNASVQLLRTDGVATESIKTFKSVSDLTRLGTTLYFNGNAMDGSTGSELWKSQGTDVTTKRVTDIFAGADSAYPHAFSVLIPGRSMVFFANNGFDGFEPWVLQVKGATKAGATEMDFEKGQIERQ